MRDSKKEIFYIGSFVFENERITLFSQNNFGKDIKVRQISFGHGKHDQNPS